MNLFQEITYRRSAVSLPLGRVYRALCQGRCCGNRTAPVFAVFGTRGSLMLCAECRDWQTRIIRNRISEIRRDR